MFSAMAPIALPPWKEGYLSRLLDRGFSPDVKEFQSSFRGLGVKGVPYNAAL